MFCEKCGKEISNGASFCPFCGVSIGVKNNIEAQNTSHQKKKKSKINPFIILVIIIVLFIPATSFVEKCMVKQNVSNYMQIIKEGPDEAAIDNFVKKVVTEATEYETIGNVINNFIDGKSLSDIYKAVMCHMDYDIQNVEKIKSGHYKITVNVENLNAENVIKETIKVVGKKSFINIFSGENKDTSIASSIKEASDNLYNQNDDSNMVFTEVVLHVNKGEDGKWVVSYENGLDAFIRSCTGITY